MARNAYSREINSPPWKEKARAEVVKRRQGCGGEIQLQKRAVTSR